MLNLRGRALISGMSYRAGSSKSLHPARVSQLSAKKSRRLEAEIGEVTRSTDSFARRIYSSQEYSREYPVAPGGVLGHQLLGCFGRANDPATAGSGYATGGFENSRSRGIAPGAFHGARAEFSF